MLVLVVRMLTARRWWTSSSEKYSVKKYLHSGVSGRVTLCGGSSRSTGSCSSGSSSCGGNLLL